MGKKIRWVCLITAPNQTVAEMWKELLEGEHISVMLRSSHVFPYLGVSASPCDLMVPESQWEKALEALPSAQAEDDNAPTL